jgi:hypothetical protein
MKTTSLLVVLCITLMLACAGCTNPSVTTTSYVNAQVGTGVAQLPDPTAQTVIDADSGDATGCNADGGPQPAAPPSLYGWYAYGTSSKAGQCNFPGFADSTWFYSFYSSACAGTGQNAYWQGYLTGNNVSETVCSIPDYNAAGASSHFAIAGSLPSTVTINGSGLTSTYGMPQLLAFDSALALEATVNATSVATGGTSATFSFPALITGGMHMLALKNLGPAGEYSVVDMTYFNLGTAATLSSPFGVDAVDIVRATDPCNPRTGVCTPSSTTHAAPILTQYYSGDVTNWVSGGSSITVGSEPVAVKTYGRYSQTLGAGNGQYTLSGPASAIVANSGSSSVSLVTFSSSSTTNLTVGAQPLAVTVNGAGTYGYVASYGNGSVTEINLSTKTVSRTLTGLTGAQSVAVDPSGSYVWVGGANNLYKVSLSNFTVAGTIVVSGSVTSMAASNAQNELVYTLVQNCCSSSSDYIANELKLSTLTNPGAYAHATAAAYAPYTMNGTLPSAATVPTATAVSVQFGNGVAASSTPTGFVVYDVVSHQQLMAGTTPTPVRGIASDPLNTVVYLTLPDSNEYIAVPMP